MASTMVRPITDEEISTFWENGAVCLRGVVDPEWLDSLVEPIEALLHDPATTDLTAIAAAVKAAGANGEDRILEDEVPAGAKAGSYSLHTDTEVDAIKRFETASMLPEIAGHILRSATIDLFVDQILVKESGSPIRTAFHVDESYFNVTGDKVCTLWVPLDEVSVESGAMGFVRGSHRWEASYLANNFISQGTGPNEVAQGRVRLPDIEGRPEDFDIVYYETKPGDVTIHHYKTAHGSGGNHTRDQRRRAVAVRYCGDDVLWNPAPGVKLLDLRAFNNGLKPGDSLDLAGDIFPRCWTRSA